MELMMKHDDPFTEDEYELIEDAVEEHVPVSREDEEVQEGLLKKLRDRKEKKPS
jgi:hypothetical protein